MQARSLFDSPHHTASSRWIQRTASRLCVGICDLWDNIHPPRISHHWSPPSPHMRFVGHTLLWHWWIWGLVHKEFQDRRQTRNCWFPTSKYRSLWYRRHSHLSFGKPPGSLLWCSHPLVFWPTTALTTSWRRSMCHLQSSSKTKWSKRYHTHRIILIGSGSNVAGHIEVRQTKSLRNFHFRSSSDYENNLCQNLFTQTEN